MKKYIKIIIILSILIVVILGIKFSGLEEYLNLETLKENKDKLEIIIRNNFILTTLIFIGIYFVVVALSLPGASILTIGGGFMYSSVLGIWVGTLVSGIVINLGATLGAAVVFVLARYLLGSKIQEKYKDQLEKFNKEIEENGKSYFLTIRFIPVFPFFIINILAGLTTVKLTTYIWTTAIGIFPGTLVYAYAGGSLNEINSLKDIMNYKLFLAFVLLGVFSQIPTIIKKLKKKGKDNEN